MLRTVTLSLHHHRCATAASPSPHYPHGVTLPQCSFCPPQRSSLFSVWNRGCVLRTVTLSLCYRHGVTVTVSPRSPSPPPGHGVVAAKDSHHVTVFPTSAPPPSPPPEGCPQCHHHHRPQHHHCLCVTRPWVTPTLVSPSLVLPPPPTLGRMTAPVGEPRSAARGPVRAGEEKTTCAGAGTPTRAGDGDHPRVPEGYRTMPASSQ